jgi:hypothetical protein
MSAGTQVGAQTDNRSYVRDRGLYFGAASMPLMTMKYKGLKALIFVCVNESGRMVMPKAIC